MFDYLQKFNTLPQSLRDSVSSPAAMAVISELETKYKIDLAATVMKVMAKIVPLADLSIYFVSDFSLDQDTAKKLTAELKDRLFFSVANYLGYNASYSSIVPKTAIAPAHLAGVEKVIKDSGVVFAGVELNSRLKNILTTYLKGIRSRIDTRLTLNKEVISGGLGLDFKVIDKIFKSADEVIAGNSLPSAELKALPLNPEPVKSGLDKVRALYEKPSETRDIPYDLKTAISTGAIKKPVAPLNLPVPPEAKEKLLEKPEVVAVPVVIKPIEVVKPTPVVVKPQETLKVNIPVAPVVSVAPVVAAIKSVESVNTISNLIPAEPKIARPPEKKAGIFSKIFSEETPKQPVAEIKKPVTPVNISIASLRTEAASQTKPVARVTPVQTPITEIKSVPKVMGPIDELLYLDITNFRRFGASPAEAASKVESKIKLLEKDGYDKMVSGVVAWRSGLINSIYLKMGLEALSKGISFKQCADNYQTAKTPGVLSWVEIEAINALNSRLMF